MPGRELERALAAQPETAATAEQHEFSRVERASEIAETFDAALEPVRRVFGHEMHDRDALAPELVPQAIREIRLIHRVRQRNDPRRSEPLDHALGARDRRRGIEEAEHDGREQVEVGEEPELLDERAQAVTHDLRPRRDDREALLRQLAKELEIELGFGASPEALEKRENNVGGRRGLNGGYRHCTRLCTN